MDMKALIQRAKLAEARFALALAESDYQLEVERHRERLAKYQERRASAENTLRRILTTQMMEARP